MSKPYRKIKIGDVFGKLKVIAESSKKSKRRHKFFVCECSCEDKTIKEINSKNLISGNTRSCGCLRKKANKQKTKSALIVKDLNEKLNKNEEFIMKCNKCDTNVPNEFEFILQQNVCPKCGSKLMNPKAMEIYLELKKRLLEVDMIMDKVATCERIAMFMINNYEVIPLAPSKSGKTNGAAQVVDDVFRVQDEVLNEDADLSADEIREQEALRAESIAAARELGFNVDGVGEDEELVGTKIDSDRVNRLKRLAMSGKSGVSVRRVEE